jgi:hypothetical protein
MKRATTLVSMLVLILSLTIVSCDAMFTTNIFSKLTHPTPSAADIAKKTPAEMKDYVSSQENMKQLADDPDLKAAALANLESVYGVSAATTDQQTAAIVAAEISIQTVPAAAEFSVSILGALAEGKAPSSPASLDEMLAFIKDALPGDIASGVSPGATMPSSFSGMIDAFLQAHRAYDALGAGVGSGGGYAPGLGLTSGEKADIAVNAVIAGLIGAVNPKPNHDAADVAGALWGALVDPANAGSYFFNSLPTLSELVNGSGPTVDLVNAAGLGSLFN